MKMTLNVVLTATMILGFSHISSTLAQSRNTAYTTSQTQATQARPYEALIEKYAKKHNVPVNLAHAIVQTESSYNAQARGAAGEVGLMQIKPMTARGLGYSGSIKKLYEPATNLEYGMKYLAQAHKLGGGDTCRTILKYNAGHGAKKMNPVTQRYCSKVKTYLAAFNEAL